MGHLSVYTTYRPRHRMCWLFGVSQNGIRGSYIAYRDFGEQRSQFRVSPFYVPCLHSEWQTIMT
jgi:hypothetical protein